MEDYANESCSIIYFCAGAEDDIFELYHKKSPPTVAANTARALASLDEVYQNVRTLLDEDQGGFNDVFVSSRPESCLERLELYANTAPAIVLVELHSSSHGGLAAPTLHKDKRKGALSFLRSLSDAIQGAQFQKHVLPFALVTFDESPRKDSLLDSSITTDCFHAGAAEVLRSPLSHEDIHRLIGRYKDGVRPPARLIGAPMAQNLVDSIHNTSEPKIASHRPDERLASERKAVVELAVRNWHFPAQDFNMDELTYAAMFMLENILKVPELEAYGLSRPHLMTFLLATRRQYKHDREVYYHNWRHAVDVTQSLYCFLLDIRLCPPADSDERPQRELNSVEKLLTPLDGLILLISAIGHDVGHPGVNNAFLVACNHPLAQAYNDKSVLENYHCAAYSQLLRRHWPALGSITGFRATMISTILATDMQRHFEYMSNMGEFKKKVEKSETTVDEWSDKDKEHARELIMALLMKAADISNVARPYEVSSKWASILMTEFARQGELESELQIPTCLFGGPPDTEDLLAKAQSQKGFMSLFGTPLFFGIAEIMPSVSCAVRELENNKAIWDQKIDEETKRRNPASGDAHVTFSSVTKTEVEEATSRNHSEPNLVPIQEGQTPSTPTKRGATTGTEASPSRHAAHEARHQFVDGIPLDGDHRASMPFLGSPALPRSSHGGSSRRSSKDLALDHQLAQLTAFAHQNLNSPNSRRASGDAGWQIHQSYPSSRRGSKDESLTTILVTSGGTPNRRSSPSSPGKSAKSSPGKPSGKRGSTGLPFSQKQNSRTSVPSSRSHNNSTATAATTQQSQSTHESTQPSSLSPEDAESTPPAPHPSIPSTEDPFMVPGNWPSDADGMHRTSTPLGLPESPPNPPQLGKSESPLTLGRPMSGESEDTRETPRKEVERGVRESRSRSRLRGLKFWKKKRDSPAGIEGAVADSSSGTP